MKRRLLSLAVIALLLGVTTAVEWRLGNLPREDPLGKRLLYLPTFEGVSVLSLGNKGLAADLFYLWTIQYYSALELNERFLYLGTMFDLITDLDPLYFDAYALGGMLMAMASIRDPETHRQALISLYDKGIAAMPDDYALAEIAAWDFFTMLKDPEMATRYLEIATTRPEAPDRIRRILGRWRDGSHLWTFEESIAYWKEAIKDSTTERDRDYARSHLYDVVAERDRVTLNPMLETFRAVHGRCPKDMDEVVRVGLLRSVPHDYFGQAYGLDPNTCKLMPKNKVRASRKFLAPHAG